MGTYSQFGLFSNYLCNKNWTIPRFIILISNRANFAVRGPSSFRFAVIEKQIHECSAQSITLGFKHLKKEDLTRFSYMQWSSLREIIESDTFSSDSTGNCYVKEVVACAIYFFVNIYAYI